MKWLMLIVTGILVAALLSAGCLDDEPGAPPLPPPDIVQPNQLLMVTGNVTGDGIPGGTIDTLTFSVKLVNPEKAVDIEKITIIYADTIKTETLIPVEGYRGDPPTGTWGILSVNNEVGKPNNRIEDNEEFVIRINPRAYLPPNRMVTVVVRTPGGTPMTFKRIAPPTIVKEGNMLLTL